MSERSTPEQRVGEALRKIRKDRGLSLTTVAEFAGVSASFLSQVERGRSNPGFGTLRSLCEGYGISLADLFGNTSSEGARVLPKAERPQIEAGEVRKYMLTRPPLRHFEIFLGEFDPGVSTGDAPYNHGDSQEILIVLSGKVLLEVDGREYVMSEGDSAEYASSQMHRVENISKEVSRVIWVVSPVTSQSSGKLHVE